MEFVLIILSWLFATSKLYEFNNELRAVKKWANNPWTNWFNNQDIASIDYIELNNH